MTNVIEAHDLVKTYGTLNAVDHLDLAVKGGTVFSLLGPNGAGKTTTVEILEGLRKATGGSATILGSSVATDRFRVEDREDPLVLEGAQAFHQSPRRKLIRG